MSEPRSNPCWEWPLLALLTATIMTLLFTQARGTRQRYQDTSLDVVSVRMEFVQAQARHDRNYALSTRLLSLATTNAGAADLVRRHGLAIVPQAQAAR